MEPSDDNFSTAGSFAKAAKVEIVPFILMLSQAFW